MLLNKIIANEKLYKSRFGRTRFLLTKESECNARFTKHDESTERVIAQR